MKLNKLISYKVFPTKLFILLSATLLIILAVTPMAIAYNQHSLSLGHDYGKTSPFCLNCHDLARLAKLSPSLLPTIDATCITCHDIHRATPNDLRHRAGNRSAMGTASSLTAYKINTYSKYSQNGHRLGAGADTSLIGKLASNSEQNLLPVSNKESITKISDWRYWQTVYAQDPTPLSLTSPSSSVITCNSCHSSHPSQNFSVSAVSETLTGLTQSSTTAAEIELCLSCHPSYASNNNGGANHNHPDRFCLDCHGNTTNNTSNQDFPHTGNTDLLSDIPDSLCLRCHISESLP